MSTDTYARVDAYLDDLFGGPDPQLQQALARSETEGLPPISVSSNLGRFLHVLTLACGARQVLEIGTLGGYSAIWMARALPDGGRLVSLEFDRHHAGVAQRNVSEAGLSERVDIRVGPALDTLGDMVRQGEGPFDMVFIDADKPPYTEYLQAAVRLARPGTLIVADNVVRGGEVAAGPSKDEAVAGMQRFNAAMASHPRLRGAIVQGVGAKGHDGMAFAVVSE